MSSDPSAPDSGGSKRSVIQIRPGEPLSFPQVSEAEIPSVEATNPVGQAGRAFKAYRDAAKDLLSGKYQDLQPFAPNYLREPCNITVIGCTNGLIVRYDVPTTGPVKVRAGKVHASLTDFGPPFSEYLIHFPPYESYDPGPNGPQFQFTKFNLTSDDVEPVATVRPLIMASPDTFNSVVPLPPPHKPPCLVSVTNEFEVVMGGLIVPADSDPSKAEAATHEFLTRSKIKLQLGWQAIEVYPLLSSEYWNPENAPLWAETDLLAAVARQQFADAQFAALDPNVTARKTFQNLAAQFTALLEGPEEPLHQFLKRHPQLLCPGHTKVWSKLPLGDRVTDFVFRKPANEYLLVEIESPIRELFRKDGQQREELTHAFNQILDWRIYLEDNLGKVQNEMGLTGISSNPESLIVIGRSSFLSEENRRKATTLQNQVPKLRILTYEDLLQHAKAVAENLFGPLDITGENIEFYYRST